MAAVHAGLGYALVAGLPGVAMETIRERTVTGISLNSRGHGGDPATSEGVPEGIIVQRPVPPQPPVGLLEARQTGCIFGFIDNSDQSIALGHGFDLLTGPGFPSRYPRPANDKATWFGTDDIPLAQGEVVEDSMSYSLIVGADGRVAACEIVRASFSATLDQAICRALSERARFEPASDENGTPAVGTYNGTVKWDFPDPPT